MKNFKISIVSALAFLASLNYCFAHGGGHGGPELHINPRWSECSFQLDPSLTQSAWRQFTKEAGLVTYFRPLIDAKPMGKLNFEVSILKWETGINDNDAAWNDTFVHPDSVHWLFEGPRLAFPGLTGRVGITEKLDAGFYFTKSPGGNYGFYGGQLQYNLVNNLEKNWAASARMSFTSLFGPEDLKFTGYGLDVVASKEFKIYSDWASVSPYVGLATYLSSTRETTDAVDLKNENILGGQAMIGAALKLSLARLSVEYSFAQVNTLSFKIGVSF